MKLFSFALGVFVLGCIMQSQAEAQGIRYLFAPKVEHTVDSLLTSIEPDRMKANLYLVLHTMDDMHAISVHDRDAANVQINRYVDNSNRYAIIGGFRMAILLDSDFRFGVAEDDMHTLVRTQLIDGMAQVKFDRFGRIGP